MNKHMYQSNYVLFSHLAYIWVFIFPALAQLPILKTMKCEKKIESFNWCTVMILSNESLMSSLDLPFISILLSSTNL